jgi:nickel/cobalt exporter
MHHNHNHHHTHSSKTASFKRLLLVLCIVSMVVAGGLFFVEPNFASVLFWIQEQQRLFHETLGTRLRTVAETHSFAATAAVMMIGFWYGVFHAAGPGHGKVIIAGYVLAGRHTVRRGLLVAALSSLLQAITAVTLVLVLYKILGLARQETEEAAQYLEIFGFSLMAIVGGALLLRGLREAFKRNVVHGHTHHEHHEHHEGCSHTINPVTIAKTKDTRALILMILSIGIRPCAGAIMLLVFSCILGVVTAGVLATFAMALGTFITTATLAVLTVQSKQGLLKLFGASESLLSTVHATLSIVGGLVICAVAVLFLLANIQSKSLGETRHHPLSLPAQRSTP